MLLFTQMFSRDLYCFQTNFEKCAKCNGVFVDNNDLCKMLYYVILSGKGCSKRDPV